MFSFTDEFANEFIEQKRWFGQLLAEADDLQPRDLLVDYASQVQLGYYEQKESMK
jgi:hypothetical protein